jgi:hypothetical protein
MIDSFRFVKQISRAHRKDYPSAARPSCLYRIIWIRGFPSLSYDKVGIIGININYTRSLFPKDTSISKQVVKTTIDFIEVYKMKMTG